MPQDHVQELFQESFSQGGQFGCLGATATPEKKSPKHSKGKHNRVGKDVLFEFACAKDSNLGKVGPEHGVKVVGLCKEDIDLENPHRLVLYQGVPSIVPSNANHAFNGNI